jgi:hypothetical protein
LSEGSRSPIAHDAEMSATPRAARPSLAVSRIQPHSRRLVSPGAQAWSSRAVPSVIPATSDSALQPCTGPRFAPVRLLVALRGAARIQSRPISWQIPDTSRARTLAGSGLGAWSIACAAGTEERDACLTSGLRVGRRYPRHVAVSIACLDPIGVGAH